MSVQNSAGGPGAGIAPTVIATAMVGLVGTWASVAGELSMRLGRKRLVRLAMTSAGVCPPAPDRP